MYYDTESLVSEPVSEAVQELAPDYAAERPPGGDADVEQVQ
jgi:hypothetical protein